MAQSNSVAQKNKPSQAYSRNTHTTCYQHTFIDFYSYVTSLLYCYTLISPVCWRWLQRQRVCLCVCVWYRLSRPAQQGCITSLLQMPRLLAAELYSLCLLQIMPSLIQRTLLLRFKISSSCLITKEDVLMSRFHMWGAVELSARSFVVFHLHHSLCCLAE